MVINSGLSESEKVMRIWCGEGFEYLTLSKGSTTWQVAVSFVLRKQFPASGEQIGK
jgi:hypothetical protein